MVDRESYNLSLSVPLLMVGMVLFKSFSSMGDRESESLMLMDGLVLIKSESSLWLTKKGIKGIVSQRFCCLFLSCSRL
jgi:hypothetical protein